MRLGSVMHPVYHEAMHTPTQLLVFSLAIFAIVQLTQKLPWPPAWLQRKPLGCPTCLSWWLAIAGAVLEHNAFALPSWAAAAGGALVLEGLLSYLKPQPPLV